ncbi:calcium-binding protein [Streptomyces litchfieldiae]|uniref:Calcium-binding protein n=1 Tax=Streptomyces litchfieldiae TaxID=3075543 RepID=A0ABU2MQ31_9ACTN|nr:calcium-binding protein [Streptomyces sp. DSM 44938]MDT0343660.1 calcium-binding protein [Streptomyces sp. DSM 44938]
MSEDAPMFPSRISPALSTTALTLLAIGSAITPASATGADADTTATITADWRGQSLIYRAGAGQANDLQIMDMPPSADVRRIAFNDEVPIRAGDNCTQPDPNDATRVVCELPANADLPGGIRVLLGDGDDQFFSDAPGVSTVHAGAGDDELHAHSARVVLGAGGDDMLMGGVVMDGGDGMDHLMGDYRDQYLWGGADNDHIEAFGGDDFVSAGSGDDHVDGGEGDDVLSGGRGDDMIVGGPGTDRVWGGPGADEITE